MTDEGEEQNGHSGESGKGGTPPKQMHYLKRPPELDIRSHQLESAHGRAG
jgi:hypothetical protein